ncbi:hypothetical protein JM84_2279 [Dokdonia sp. Hel_I_63]|nr:hypothetical protein JM84_2279 [Dokdonia sp. Hel_I_63]
MKLIVKLSRIVTIAQLGYYTYDWVKNKRSFKEKFIPNLRKIKRKLM